MNDVLFVELAGRLEGCRQRLERGEDVTPLEIGRLEGLLEALLLMGERPAAVLARCDESLSPSAPISVILNATGQPRLHLRQTRAPVEPTTKPS